MAARALTSCSVLARRDDAALDARLEEGRVPRLGEARLLVFLEYVLGCAFPNALANRGVGPVSRTRA